jgi:hypothetical protein
MLQNAVSSMISCGGGGCEAASKAIRIALSVSSVGGILLRFRAQENLGPSDGLRTSDDNVLVDDSSFSLCCVSVLLSQRVDSESSLSKIFSKN